MIPALIGAAGTLLGGVLGMQGQARANQQNADLQHESNVLNIEEGRRNRDFQAQQSQAQMDFQERMSNTSYQRGVDDLKKAGLNPILGINNGASTPSGAAGSGAQGTANAAHMENTMNAFQGLMSNAAQAANMVATVGKTNAEKNLINSQIGKKSAESDLEQDLYQTVKPFMKWIRGASQSTAKGISDYKKEVQDLTKKGKEKLKTIYLGNP